ncbi:MAG: hypothetical protein MUO64_02325 [Anaerolineales bacterium]|nr:hypothetical protein [Anaerolineales bacterium]
MNLWFILAVHPNQLAAKLEGRLQDAIIITQKDDLRHAQGTAGVALLLAADLSQALRGHAVLMGAAVAL